MSLSFSPFDNYNGHYRWYYVDVSGDDFCAVAIFMLGAVFSPAAWRAARSGHLPLSHCAVNFAFYQGGKRRAWVFSTYEGATLSGDTLRIGASQMRYTDNSLDIDIDDRQAPRGKAVRARFTLEATAPASPVIALDDTRHAWRVLAPRARATLDFSGHHAGVGYHDMNWGTEPLGGGLAGWRWSRVHGQVSSDIVFDLGREAIRVTAADTQTSVTREAAPRPALARSAWGLPLPTTIGSLPVGQTLERSPFYARLAATSAGTHAIAEVADFRRFGASRFRWMAHFRQRQGAR